MTEISRTAAVRRAPWSDVAVWSVAGALVGATAVQAAYALGWIVAGSEPGGVPPSVTAATAAAVVAIVVGIVLNWVQAGRRSPRTGVAWLVPAPLAATFLVVA